MTFRFTRLRIPEVICIEPYTNRDERGFFREIFKHSEFSEYGIPETFVQDNQSRSVRGVIRGLHYQKDPRAQGKLVTAITGEILDVAVDIRRGSPTFGEWTSLKLAAESGNMLYVPPGFAHGFCVLSERADVVYKVTVEYSVDLDRGIRWNDSQLSIEWPATAPILSAKDAGLPLLQDADINYEYNNVGI